MAQKEVELILTRRLAEYLALPILIVDAQGTLVYFNEAAEKILGCRFDETNELLADKWMTTLAPTDDVGTSLDMETWPLTIALKHQRLNHARFWICGLNGVRKQIEMTAFPLIGHAARFVGAVALLGELG